jgi:molybdate transport system substrate-binding protein
MTSRIASFFYCILALFLFVTPATAEEVRLSAAASLREVVNELTERFAREHPGITFVKNFGGSGTLARQIENGAPVDIFIPSSRLWMTHLSNKGLVDKATVGLFARNSLVFIGQTRQKITAIRDVVKLRSIALGSPKSVPAGEYAMQALSKEGLLDLLAKKLVYTRDVREALMYAERGEVDGAFIYRTDASQARRAKVLFAVPGNLHGPIIYPVGLTTSGAGKGAAAAFRSYLEGYEARSILMRYGFEVK